MRLVQTLVRTSRDSGPVGTADQGPCQRCGKGTLGPTAPPRMTWTAARSSRSEVCGWPSCPCPEDGRPTCCCCCPSPRRPTAPPAHSQSHNASHSDSQSQRSSFTGSQSQRSSYTGSQSQRSSYTGSQSQRSSNTGSQSQRSSYTGNQSQRSLQPITQRVIYCRPSTAHATDRWTITMAAITTTITR